MVRKFQNGQKIFVLNLQKNIFEILWRVIIRSQKDFDRRSYEDLLKNTYWDLLNIGYTKSSISLLWIVKRFSRRFKEDFHVRFHEILEKCILGLIFDIRGRLILIPNLILLIVIIKIDLLENKFKNDKIEIRYWFLIWRNFFI